MIRGLDSVYIGSQSAKKLAKFYREVVGLKSGEDYVNDETGEEGYGFVLGHAGLNIADHSKIKGPNKQPERMMINIEVDDIEKEVKRLKKTGLKPITDIYHVPDYGLIATFKDPEGNYFQFVQVKAN